MKPKNQSVGRVLRPKTRVRRVELRWTVDEHDWLVIRAHEAQMSVSEYIRHTALGKTIVARVDQAWVNELRRIGALLKHHYPAVKSWSETDKKRYWHTRDELLDIANAVSELIGARKVRREQ
jgi:hypothetical protein